MKQAEGEDQPGTEISSKTPQAQTFGPVNFDHFANRNAKIAQLKRKKEIEA